MMKMVRNHISVLFFLILTSAGRIQASDLPLVRTENGAGQLVVHGRPFLIRGGELGNSSAGTSARADAILPEMARMHLNTVLIPVAWEQVERQEGIPLADVCERATPVPHGTARRVSKRRAASVLSRGVSRHGARHRFLVSRHLLAPIRVLVEKIRDSGKPNSCSGSENRQRPLQRTVCVRGCQSVWALSIRH